MDLDSFKASLRFDEPPPEMPGALRALWWDARGAWDKAHVCAREDDGDDAAWVHAYLHRREGDDRNAAYWYRRAKRLAASGALESEWAEIASVLLDRS